VRQLVLTHVDEEVPLGTVRRVLLGCGPDTVTVEDVEVREVVGHA